MARLALVAVVAVLAALAVAETASALTCNDVTSSISPCLLYATGKATAPSERCCDGVKSLSGKASSTADKRTACSCLKNLASSLGSLNAGNAASIPAKCGVSVPVPISTSVDCSKVN